MKKFAIDLDNYEGMSDPERTSFGFENNYFEFLDIFSRELILMHTTADSKLYTDLMNRHFKTTEKEVSLIQKGNEYTIQTPTTEEAELCINENGQYDYDKLSGLDEYVLFLYVRKIGPAKTAQLLNEVPSKYNDLYNKLYEYHNVWTNAYINGLSYLSNYNNEDVIDKMFSKDDLITIFYTGMGNLREYMIIKENESLEDINNDMNNALLLLNRLADIAPHLHLNSDQIKFFKEYKERFTDQYEYRLQNAGINRSSSTRHKKVLI